MKETPFRKSPNFLAEMFAPCVPLPTPPACLLPALALASSFLNRASLSAFRATAHPVTCTHADGFRAVCARWLSRAQIHVQGLQRHRRRSGRQ
eukprot:2721971-Rhodomonas_salina.1